MFHIYAASVTFLIDLVRVDMHHWLRLSMTCNFPDKYCTTTTRVDRRIEEQCHFTGFHAAQAQTSFGSHYYNTVIAIVIQFGYTFDPYNRISYMVFISRYCTVCILISFQLLRIFGMI